jgi:hypothetical protein
MLCQTYDDGDRRDRKRIYEKKDKKIYSIMVWEEKDEEDG